jgi:hypothetical protein
VPTVRVVRDIALADGRSYSGGEQAVMTPAQAQDAVAGGWGELMGDKAMETPEGSRAKRQTAPERRG